MKGAASQPRFRGTPVDLLIDVRTKLEFWLGHLPGAVCIPVQDLPDAMAKLDDLSVQSRIVVYCASGARSAEAAKQLRSAGYSNVDDAGGIAAARSQLTA